MKKFQKAVKETEYVCPRIECMEIRNEGVLCSSTEDLVPDDSWIELLEE